LNHDHVSLVGVMRLARSDGVRLEKAPLLRSDFQGTDLRNAT